MLKIDHRITVNAPKETVWNVITDLDAYGQWNSFVVECRSTLEENKPINMQVRVLPFFAMPQKETIFEHQPGEKLSYGISMPLGALKSYRSHEVKQLVPGVAEYISTFELSGWLSPLVERLLGKQLRRGFNDMSEGVQLRAQSVYR